MSKGFGRALTLAAICGVALCFARDAWALRPGGGHSFGGGGGGGFGGGGGGGGGFSGGGGGDGAVIFELIFWLLFEIPQIGIPLIVCLAVWYRYQAKNDTRADVDWDSTSAWEADGELDFVSLGDPREGRSKLARIAKLDPDFSEVLFTDFANRLYASLHGARGDGPTMAGLAPYINDNAREQLLRRQPRGEQISNVIVGSMEIKSVQVPRPGHGGAEGPQRFTVRLRFESNMRAGAGASSQTEFVRETWTLRRDASAKSRPPERIESLGCPNCGAPFESTDNRVCEHCGQTVADGRFDWQVVNIELHKRQAQTVALGGYAEERGTFDYTRVDNRFDDDWAKLCADDPNLKREELEARITLIFHKLNLGWSGNDTEAIRPYVSAGLHDYLRYWIEAYKTQGLRNHNDKVRIEWIRLVKIRRDRYYDAITVRVKAAGLDYTVKQDNGLVVGGSKTRERTYTEYWTLIRRAGVKRAASATENCPNCAAALAISHSGQCQYCDAQLIRGDFDWVLSRIEQDELYRG